MTPRSILSRHGLMSMGLPVVLAAMLACPPVTQAQTVYVSNEKDNTLSVIDAATMTVTQTLKVGKQPRGILLSPDGRWLYICASSDDAIQVMDTATNRLVHNLPSGEDPETFALTPDGKRLYVANENSNSVTVIDVDSRRVAAQFDVGVEPEGMAVSPDGKTAINTSETTSLVHWVDTATNQVIDNTPVGQRPRVAVFSPDGSRLWVSSEIGGTVAVIDVASRKVIHTIGFQIQGVPKDKVQPVGIRLTSDGRLGFVALGPANHVAVVDPATFEVKGYILSGKRVWQMAFGPGETQLYTTNGITGDVTVIDVASQKAVKSIKVGRYPWGVAVKP